jgi:thioredoxin reductase (NADPH)
MKTKCVVIGAGPAGMSAALYLKRAGVDFIIIDIMPGGELLKIDKIENYLGFSGSGTDLALKMIEQLRNLGVNILKAKVEDVSKKDKFVVKTLHDEIISDTVIVATGRMPTKLGLDGEDELLGKGISYCATCDGAFFRGKDVAVVGGGDAAYSEALYLSEICHKVYVLVRKEARASDILEARVNLKDNIEVMKNTSIVKLNYHDVLESVNLNNGSLNISGIFVAIGGKPNTSFLPEIDMKNGYMLVDENMESSIPGLYGAGDIIVKSFYQVVTAVNDGAVAANSIGKEK